jgi:glutamate 5-kinase
MYNGEGREFSSGGIKTKERTNEIRANRAKRNLMYNGRKLKEIRKSINQKFSKVQITF